MLALSSAFAVLCAWLVLRARPGLSAHVKVNFIDQPPPALVDVPASAVSALKRRPLTDAEIRGFYPALSHLAETDPYSLYHNRAGLDLRLRLDGYPGGEMRFQTNAIGLQNDFEVAEAHPDLRVLVTGDSHTQGACDTAKAFVSLLGPLLESERKGERVESLNAACGGYSFFNYLGALERLLPLEPDVFVTAVFGGNDFDGALLLYTAFEGLAPPPGYALFRPQVDAAAEIWSGAVFQGLCGEKYFAEYPEQVDLALECATKVAREIIALCSRQSIEPVFLYIPPLHTVEWDEHAEELEQLAAVLEIEPQQHGVLDSIADRFLAAVRTSGGTVLDLRPSFLRSPLELFWHFDAHINLDGQALVARELVPVIQAVHPERSSRAGSRSAAR